MDVNGDKLFSAEFYYLKFIMDWTTTMYPSLDPGAAMS